MTPPQRRRGRGIRPWLLTVKLFGVILFVGGLAASAGLMYGAPAAADLRERRLLAECVHWILIPGTIGGGILAIAAGMSLWLQMPRTFLRMRWFRLKLLLLVVLVPTFHLLGRLTAMKLYTVLDEPGGGLSEAGALWDRLAAVFSAALLSMLLIVWVGRVKPRLGQKFASARSRREAEAKKT